MMTEGFVGLLALYRLQCAVITNQVSFALGVDVL